MRRLRVLISTIAFIFTLVVGILLQSQLTSPTVFAQIPHLTPSMGDYGYTYNIQPPLSVFSVYNVMGQVNSKVISGVSKTQFQTYAVRQSGATIARFRILGLRRRIYSRREGGCPLELEDEQSRVWKGGSGQKDVWFLNITNPDDYWERMAVGRHKLVHPYSYNLATPPASPSYFYVSIDEAYNPANINTWNGAGLGCGARTDLPPTIDDNLP